MIADENVEEELVNEFLTNIMTNIEDMNHKVVSSHPRIVSFIKSNPKYKNLLPVGIRI